MSNSERLEDIACDICGSAQQTVIYKYSVNGDSINIVECKYCGCTYLCPRPKTHYLPEFYGENYYSFRCDDENNNLSSRGTKDTLRRTVMKHHFGYANIAAADTLRIPPAVSILFKGFVAVPRYQQNGRLLDVGCGAGQKLQEFKSLGWDVRGVELSQQAADEGRKMGLEIAAGSLYEAGWPAEYFTAITFYHSLEHLPSPRLALREAYRLMNHGGELLVVVPNFGCLERKLFGRNWGWLDVPVHLYHFTEATLTRIISEAGFKIDTLGFSPGGCAASLSVFNGSKVARKVFENSVRLFGVACAVAGSGKALIVSARK